MKGVNFIHITRVYPPRYKSQELFNFGTSIILEDPAIIPRQNQVRILLVYKKVPSCDPLLLRRLAFTTADVRRQPPYLSINRPTHFGTSLPTITIEVYFEKTPELAYATLRVIHSVNSLSDFNVAYGWIQDFSEDSRSCTVAFESNWPFHKVPEFALPLAISHVRTRSHSTDPLHCNRAAVKFDVRVFSPHKSRLNSKMVFEGVIARTIGQHLILDWQLNWRTDLLNFGLTCKSTSTALIAFFEIQREECLRYLGSDKPSIDAVLSSLRWRPDRANLIRCMAPTFYKEFPRPITGHEYAASCEAFIQLLSSAKEIKQLTLSYIPPTLYSQLVQSLQNLHNLELFDVKANSTRPGTQNLSFLREDVFKFLSQWPRLQTIDIELRSPAFVFKREPETDVPLKTTCNLKTICVTNSKMEPFDLVRFLPTSEPPRLNRLHLASVTGIGKGEITSFLRSVSPFIVDIHISGCRFLTAADEENSTLDETLSSMPLLKNLTITTSGDLVGPSCIYARQNRISGSNLRLTNTRPFRRQDVIDALRSSKWDKVVVAWDSPDHDGEALRVAKQQGVEFGSSLVV